MTCFRNESNKPHFVMVPLAAQGHLIPMIDMAHILVECGVHISLIITKGNADRIRTIIDAAKESKLSIEFVELNFPHAKFGLPSGCESVDHVTNPGQLKAFMDAIYSLNEPLEAFIKSLEQQPNCIISDMYNAWTGSVARKFHIPRVIFHGLSAFYVSACSNMFHHKVFNSVTNDNEYVTVPDFPVKLEATKSQIIGFLNNPGFDDIRKRCLEEELTSNGVMMNTFLDLERPFVKNYEKVMNEKKVWTMGPACLYNKDVEMKMGRGNKEAIDQTHRVLTWLNGRDTASVLYINFGSITNSNPQQLMEIGNALEASNKPFVWVIKKIEILPAVEKWLSERFEERTKDRGLIIVGWAPQMVILSHPAIGGFMTHCGVNSMLEAISMGVPMITWPRFGDQFINQNLIVDVLKIGVSLGVKVPNSNYDVMDVVMVKNNNIRKAVSALMDGGIEADERRQRSKDFSEKAKKAMEEGGSSFINLTDFIHYFTEPEAR